MKVFALNSSPRPEGQSKTGLMLRHLLEGMREAGADVESVNLCDKEVNNCTGCYTCWARTPGVCIHRDDMTRELFPKWCEADLAVYATPLYHYSVNATLKAFIERTLPATGMKGGALKIVAAALFLACAGCGVTKGFTEATYNHLNQGAPLKHAEYQQERSRITSGDEGKRP